MIDSTYNTPKIVLVGTIEPVFFRKDMVSKDSKMLAQGRNFRIMTRRGWSYTVGPDTARFVAESELRHVDQ